MTLPGAQCQQHTPRFSMIAMWKTFYAEPLECPPHAVGTMIERGAVSVSGSIGTETESAREKATDTGRGIEIVDDEQL